MAILKRTPKPVSELVRLSLYTPEQDPDEYHPADERPALQFTDSGQIEMARQPRMARSLKITKSGKRAMAVQEQPATKGKR